MALHLAKGKRGKKSCREPSIRRACPGQSGAERGSSSRRGDTSDVKRVQVRPPLTVPSFSQSGQEPYSSGIRRPCPGQWRSWQTRRDTWDVKQVQVRSAIYRSSSRGTLPYASGLCPTRISSALHCLFTGCCCFESTQEVVARSPLCACKCSAEGRAI
jgi:hypothetical protein